MVTSHKTYVLIVLDEDIKYQTRTKHSDNLQQICIAIHFANNSE